jgi:hypothetical protein
MTVYLYNYVYMCDFLVQNSCNIEMGMGGTPGTLLFLRL